MHKRSIIQKTIQVGSSTLLSRLLGIVREYLQVKYLGAGALSDAFFTALKTPNSLRKIFAEGALSASFIPTLVSIKNDKQKINGLITISFLFFEGITLLLCAFFIWKAEWLLGFIAPGFAQDQINYAATYLRILMPFIFFISSSALLAGALQSAHYFFIPAFGPVLLNIVVICALLICWLNGLAIEWYCLFIVLGGLLQFVMHMIAYIYYNFSFGSVDKNVLPHFKHVLQKFIPCTIAMSIMEVSLYIDTSFASYLPAGSISLLNYANRFMGIPLGVFAVAFSTILLPHFSRIQVYAPKRLSFYLLEATKLVLWVTVPIALIMGFFGKKIFATLFLSDKFTMNQVLEAHSILIAFLMGLFFFSLNKIILNIYYAYHSTIIPTIISLSATFVNIGLNFLFMKWWHATGLALATSLSVGLLQTVLLLGVLQWRFGFKLYLPSFARFCMHYGVQLSVIFSMMLVLYFGYSIGITRILLEMQSRSWLPDIIVRFLLDGVGYWLLMGPLCALAMGLLFYSRRLFGVKLYFLE